MYPLPFAEAMSNAWSPSGENWGLSWGRICKSGVKNSSIQWRTFGSVAIRIGRSGLVFFVFDWGHFVMSSWWVVPVWWKGWRGDIAPYWFVTSKLRSQTHSDSERCTCSAEFFPKYVQGPEVGWKQVNAYAWSPYPEKCCLDKIRPFWDHPFDSTLSISIKEWCRPELEETLMISVRGIWEISAWEHEAESNEAPVKHLTFAWRQIERETRESYLLIPAVPRSRSALSMEFHFRWLHSTVWLQCHSLLWLRFQFACTWELIFPTSLNWEFDDYD